jgi:selenocysteine-specific elongation factor
VAVNLAGVRARDIARGDVLATPGALTESMILDCALALSDDARHGERVQVHHGTRDVAARLAALGDDLWQLRLERPVLAADGDHVVVRRLSPPDTLGGGTILDAAAQRHGRRPEVLARLHALRDGRPIPVGAPGRPGGPGPDRRSPAGDPGPGPGSHPPTPPPELLERLEARLREAGLALVGEAQLAQDAAALPALRAAGRAVRISGPLYAHADVAAGARARIVALIEANGSVSLGEVRDLLGTGRKPAQAFLEHLDAERVTRRGPDDRRVLRARRPTPPS